MTSTVAEPGARDRTLHVEHCMGTVFTIDIRDPGRWAPAVEAVVTWLRHVDMTFSTYRDDTDISRLRRGELSVADAHPDVGVVLDLCGRAQRETGGYFTTLLQGRIDPTGLVKGWAIERASDLLREFGATNHAVNGGGDMMLAGEAAPGRPWTVGIADPLRRSAVLGTVSGSDIAVATSGSAERGRHILDPFTARPATGVLSASIVGRSLVSADVCATAAVAMGAAAVGWLESVDGYEAMVVGDNGCSRVTTGWHRHNPGGGPAPSG